jgi:type IV secretion system protein VirB10
MTDQHTLIADDRGTAAAQGSTVGSKRRQQMVAAGVIGAFGLVSLGLIVRSAVLGSVATVSVSKKSEQVVRHEAPEPPRFHAMTIPAKAGTAPTQPVVAPAAPQTDPILEAAQRAPVTAYSRPVAVPGGVGPVEQSGFDSGETEDRGAFEKRFKSPTFASTKARLVGDRRFIVAQGTSIPCIMETAMQSDQAGFVSCVIPRDVLSDNGQVVLMEKGTQVVGEYRGGLQQGQTRLHVLWSRAKTPAGVVVDLGSAATDALGRSGIGGIVDTHFWERISAAIVLSVVSDGSAIGSSRLQKAAGVQSNAVGQAPNSAAAVAVEQSAGIKPTLHKNQGEMVSIFVARDLDFSGVYKLTVAKDSGAWVDSPHLEAEGAGSASDGRRIK